VVGWGLQRGMTATSAGTESAGSTGNGMVGEESKQGGKVPEEEASTGAAELRGRVESEKIARRAVVSFILCLRASGLRLRECRSLVGLDE
jgi:hypothetical protein